MKSEDKKQIDNESRFSSATYDNALEFLRSSPCAVTRAQLAQHIGRSVTIANRVVRKMKQDGQIITQRLVDERQVGIVTYRMAGAVLVVPPGMDLPKSKTRAVERREVERAPAPAPFRDPLVAALFGAPAQQCEVRA